ncbi:hypothetical protein [Streptomyces sp. NPDC002758]
MDAKATARYIDKTITEAVKEAENVHKDFAALMTRPVVIGFSMTSPHVLDALTNADATAAAFLEIHEVAKGNLEQVGTEKFLEAVHTVRTRILEWLRTSRVEPSGVVAVQANARHNAATKVLSRTDVIELIDEEN